MAEVLEYSFVILASVLVVGFSVVTYQSFAGTVSSAEFHASFDSVVESAASAVETGTSSVTLLLDNATLYCSHGNLLFTSGPMSASYYLPAACSFASGPMSGRTTLSFSYDGSLRVRVT